MPNWPGGPCPVCGEFMPENLIHCQVCRALLNEKLDKSSVEIPAFIPLQEIETMSNLHPDGYHIGCPHCEEELRIHRKYEDQQVQCKFCKGAFKLQLSNRLITLKAFYATCPQCSEELRIAPKYVGMKVACKHCGGKIQFVNEQEN